MLSLEVKRRRKEECFVRIISVLVLYGYSPQLKIMADNGTFFLIYQKQ